MKRLVIAAMAALTLTVHAEFKDGNKLYSQITSRSNSDEFIALGYITGVVDAYQDILFCIPGNATAGQMVDVMRNYLSSNPEIRHQAAPDLVTNAMNRIWPCAKKQGSKTL